MAVDADETARLEELEALQAIYGEAFRSQHGGKAGECSCSLDVADEAGRLLLTAHAEVPRDYPSSSPPRIWVERQSRVRDAGFDAVNLAEQCLIQEPFQPGSPVLFNWFEWIKAQAVEAAAAAGSDSGDDPRGAIDGKAEASASDIEAVEPRCSVEIVHGAPYTERKSTFQAHLARVTSRDQVEEVMRALLSINKVRHATHNMLAYRIKQPSAAGCWLPSAAMIEDFDDDGEQQAGSRMLHLLRACRASGVVVVVSRWYGGQLLGPSRFAIINNVARQLMEECGCIPPPERGAKRKK